MNGGEANGHVEVGGFAAMNLAEDETGALSGQSLQELAAAEGSAPAFVISEEKPAVQDCFKNEKEIIDANHGMSTHADEKTIDSNSTSASRATCKIDATSNDEKIADANHRNATPADEKKTTDTSSTVAANENGQDASTRTTEKQPQEPRSVSNGNAAPWTPSHLNSALLSQAHKLTLPSTKKLLILDVNGLLVARYKKLDRTIIPPGAPHGVVAKSYMFKRPFCAPFLDFCLSNFHVGIWSSMTEANVSKTLDFICPKDIQHKFLFVMHQGDCTVTGLKNPEKTTRSLFLKELVKVWSRLREFNETNTLLIDDTPHKALLNPANTAIFPEPFLYDEADTFLKGALVEYLSVLRDAADVREFVGKTPIGLPAVAPGCLHWNVYRKVLAKRVAVRGQGASVSQVGVSESPQVGSLAVEQDLRFGSLSLT